MSYKFNLIGAGRLGKQLAFSFIEQGLGIINQVYNRRFEHAKQAVDQLGSGIAIEKITQLLPASLTLITVSDDQIAKVAQRIAKTKILTPGSIVVHCSGLHDSSLLSPLAQQGCFTASVHPLRAFGHGTLDATLFQQCHGIIEGQPEALTQLLPLFQQLGMQLTRIDAIHKSSYHVAATLASNYLVTLASEALQLFKQTGISSTEAKMMITTLMQSSLDNVKQVDQLCNALSGPIARGDVATVQTHLQAISHPTTRNLYKAAGLATLSLTTLNEQKIASLTKELS